MFFTTIGLGIAAIAAVIAGAVIVRRMRYIAQYGLPQARIGDSGSRGDWSSDAYVSDSFDSGGHASGGDADCSSDGGDGGGDCGGGGDGGDGGGSSD